MSPYTCKKAPYPGMIVDNILLTPPQVCWPHWYLWPSHPAQKRYHTHYRVRPIPMHRYRYRDFPDRYRFLEIDPYQYRYRLICTLQILSVTLHIHITLKNLYEPVTYILIGNIQINWYRYGSISKNRYRIGKSPYQDRLTGIGIGRTQKLILIPKICIKPMGILIPGTGNCIAYTNIANFRLNTNNVLSSL